MEQTNDWEYQSAAGEPLFPRIRFVVVDEMPEVSGQIKRLLVANGIGGEICANGNEVLSILRRSEFQVVLCGANLPDMEGIGLMEKVHANFPGIAFVIVSASNDVRKGVDAMKAGASDYLLRPVQADALVASVNGAVEAKRMERGLEKHWHDLEKLVSHRTKQMCLALENVATNCAETVMALGYVIGVRDKATATHCQRVTHYSLELAKAMKCNRVELDDIARGAYLHDLGKIGINDMLLRKHGPLSAEERSAMEAHVRIGYEMVRRISYLAGAAETVLAHHERFDGKGYPQGLAGFEIPLGARIFAVADTLDAMTSDRPYREAQSYSVAREEISRCSGSQFDPNVVAAFLSLPAELWETIRTESQREGALFDLSSWIRREPFDVR